MYRCSICGTCSKAGQSRLLHIIHRQVPHIRTIAGEKIASTRSEIAREMPVCRSCKALLERGLSIADVYRIVTESTDEQLEVLIRGFAEPAKPIANGKAHHYLPPNKKRNRR